MRPGEWFAKGMPRAGESAIQYREQELWRQRGMPRPPPPTAAELRAWNRPPGGCQCDTPALQGLPKTAQTRWLSICPECRASAQAAEGLKFSSSAGGFIASGPTPADAVLLRAAPEAKRIDATRNSPIQAKQGIAAPGPTLAPQTTGGGKMPQFLKGPGGGTTPPGGSQGPQYGTWVDRGFGIVDKSRGWGKSKCPGPFNYNPVTGGCDPKPGRFTGGTSCPQGTTYDAVTGQCKKSGLGGLGERIIPGGDTGYLPQEWTSTEAYGTQGIIPQTRPSSTLVCPRGYVLYGKEPGMEVCLPKGMLPNKFRKWPKSPNPALSAQDMKTLRRIGTLQKRIRRVAGTAGFSCKKR